MLKQRRCSGQTAPAAPSAAWHAYRTRLLKSAMSVMLCFGARREIRDGLVVEPSRPTPRSVVVVSPSPAEAGAWRRRRNERPPIPGGPLRSPHRASKGRGAMSVRGALTRAACSIWLQEHVAAAAGIIPKRRAALRLAIAMARESWATQLTRASGRDDACARMFTMTPFA